MNLEIFKDLEQGSDLWHKARAGIPTASVFHGVTKRLKSGAYSAERQNNLYRLAGERFTGKVVETFSGGALERGRQQEDSARKLYEFQTDNVCEIVGFVKNGAWRAGCSPDSLVGTNGGMEIKSKEPRFLIECLKLDEVPEEHLPQCHGAMGVTGREWWDFVAYWEGLPLFVKRVYRDEKIIATLKAEIGEFNEELDELVVYLENYNQKKAA